MKTFEINSGKLGFIHGEITLASGYGHFNVRAEDDEGNVYDRIISDASIYDDIDNYDNESKQAEAELVLRLKLENDINGWNYGE